MALPQQSLLQSAVNELKRDPAHPVRLVVDGLAVELRLVESVAPITNDVLGDATWEGETAVELLRILKQGREMDAETEARL